MNQIDSFITSVTAVKAACTCKYCDFYLTGAWFSWSWSWLEPHCF